MGARENIEALVNMRAWAVAGASNNPEKYGHKIFRSLSEAGYRVFPLNPKEPEIAGIKAYQGVADLPETPEVVDLVVPPPATVDIVKACVAKGVKGVWFQPGSESEEAIRLARESGLIVVSGGPCAMVERRRWVS